MPPAKLDLKAKASALTSFKSETVYKDADAPSATANFVTAYKSAADPSTSLSNEYVVNVLPDFTNILMMIIYHVIQDTASLDMRSHAKVSTCTYVAYCLTIVYAHFLITDCYINPRTPKSALELLNDTVTENYIKFLLSLPVPTFLEPLLSTFVTTTTAERTNIWFRPSAAGFTHFTHFGRFYPINIFTALHDYAASVSGRTDPNTAAVDISMLEIFHVTNFPGHTNPVTMLYCNFFASLYPHSYTAAPTAAQRNSRFSSKLNQIMQGLFNPVLLRAQQQRQSFSEICIHAPTFDTPNYNPYLALLCMTSNNVNELRTLMSSVASVLTDSKIASKELASLYDTYSGALIFNHGYSTFQTPHWDADTNNLDTYTAHPDYYEYRQNGQKFSSLDDIQFAARIAFKVTFTTPPRAWNTRRYTIGRNAITFNTISGTAPAFNDYSVTVTFTPDPNSASRIPLASITSTHDFTAPGHFDIPTPVNPAPTIADVTAANFANLAIRPYNTDIDYQPNVKVLMFPEFDEDTAYTVTLFGMIIQSDELAGSLVPHLSPSVKTSEDNAIFLSSAISYNLTHLATNFKSHNPVPCSVTTPPPVDANNQFSVSAIRHPYRHFFNNLNQVTLDLGHQSTHPGLTAANNVILPTFTQTHIGYTTRTRTSRASRNHDSQPANTPNNSLLVWSPYTFVSDDANLDWDHTDYEEALESYSFLTNLRTIFGLNLRIGEIRNAHATMPVA